jgi:ribonuclease P protein component
MGRAGSDAAMTESDDRLTLSRARRIVRKGDFERARAARCAAGDSRLLVYVLPNGRSHPRVGLAVGRRHGKAARRNRLRRLLREAFRLEQHSLPAGFDYLLVPRPATHPDLAAFRRSLLRLGPEALRRWHLRQGGGQAPPDSR